MKFLTTCFLYVSTCSRRHPKVILSLALVLWFALAGTIQAQVTSSIVSDGTLGTAVNQINNLYNINGGTISGSNQFHSFDTFTVGTGDIASFNGPSGIVNILSRVTGLQSRLQQSLIDGTLQSTIPGANLFLMNPAGVVFGPNASLNVSGAVTVTTADYIRLTTVNVQFNAIPGAEDALLTSASVAAFGFLGPTAASISIQGSNLLVPVTTDPASGEPQGHSFSAIGGNIEVVADPTSGIPSTLMVPSGEIKLVSVASAGEVLASSLQSAPNINGDSFTTMGTVTISGGSTLDVSDNALAGNGRGGTIRIRGGEFVMDGSFAFANTFGDASGNETAVNVEMTGAVRLYNFSGMFASSSGLGRAGDITISGQSINLNNSSVIFSGTLNATGGGIALTAEHVSIEGGSALVTDTSGSGNGGRITVTASDTFSIFGMDASDNPSSILSNANAGGDGGSVTITAGTATLSDGSTIQTLTGFDGRAGDITLQAGTINVTGGGGLQTSGGVGSSGTITVTADILSLSGQLAPNVPSRIRSENLSTGPTGDLVINVGQLELNDNGRIGIESLGSQSGNLAVTATESISITGDSKILIDTQSATGSSLIVLSPVVVMDRGAIQTTTVGPGDAGGIFLNTGTLTLANASSIASDTTQGLGDGGPIAIMATDSILLSGNSSIRSNTAGQDGQGGTIRVNATNQVIMTGGASITASSTGSGNAGNISINAGQQFEMRDSSVKTEAAQARGGNIDIRAVDRVRLVNSTISTSVLDSNGNSGNISIDPNIVVLQNSQVLAQAVHGAGGNITITTPLFLADSSSLVSATSQFGLNGTVTARSNLSGSLGPLTAKPSQAQSLLTQRCAALVNGQASSFVVAGREQLPSDPGSWLSSPIALAGIDTDPFRDGTASDSTSNFAPRTSGLLASDRVSLRRLTPARFLMANFAESEATGCHS